MSTKLAVVRKFPLVAFEAPYSIQLIVCMVLSNFNCRKCAEIQ